MQGSTSSETYPCAALPLLLGGVIVATTASSQPAKIVRVKLQRDPTHVHLTARICRARGFRWHEHILPARHAGPSLPQA